MKKRTVEEQNLDLDLLNNDDAYSLALFTLYKLSDSNYATLCEMPYIIDKASLLRFLRYFGGQTITIPTVEELSNTVRLMVAYQSRIVRKEPLYIAMKKAGIKYTNEQIPEIKRKLVELDSIISVYNRVHNDTTDVE